jgi:phage-related protein
MLSVHFYRNDSGSEPVREWLKLLSAAERKAIGEDIKTVQFGWPLGMPLVRKMEAGLWEIRISLPGRIARILFTLEGDKIVLLHGFIKKTAQTPLVDIHTARRRMKSTKVTAMADRKERT